ncbi:MAG TPA: 30S ribosomal protein S20 [Terriglobales bacterium]|nr:30S ribosomal protein S20 [Terriglobales bacterium]
MANHVSALKRARQTERKTTVNRNNKSRLRTAVRRFREALASGNAEQAKSLFSDTVSVLDKSVQKGVLHKNTASRYKSRLSARLTAMSAK